MPKVSIVIPSYNRGEFITATLESIRSQTFSDFEVVFIDDGSTDDTEKIFQNFARDDYRFKYFKQKNSERAVARTYGISLAVGDYVCLVDSDDTWYPDKLQKQIEILDANPDVIFCYASVNRIDLEGNPVKAAPRQHEGYDGDVYLELLMRNFIPSVTPMIRKQALVQVGAQVTELIPYEDWDFWLRLSKLGKFYHIKQPLGDYRLHPGQSVQNVKAEHVEKVTLAVLERNIDSGLDPKIIAEAYSLANLRFAYWYLVSDKLDLAHERLRRAQKFASSRLTDYRWWGLWFASLIYPVFKEPVKNFLGSFH